MVSNAEYFEILFKNDVLSLSVHVYLSLFHCCFLFNTYYSLFHYCFLFNSYYDSIRFKLTGMMASNVTIILQVRFVKRRSDRSNRDTLIYLG